MNTIALCLANEVNEYQEMIKEEAIASASRAGWQLETYSAEDKVTQQIKQIYECLHRAPELRPQALLVMAVRVNAMNRIAHEVLQGGIGWVCLNRRMDELPALRREFPSLPISFVSPDQREIGRIQGRQFRALLPHGGRLLYVQGEATGSTAQERLAGMREAIQGSKIDVVSVLDGNWTAADTERMLNNWLRMVMSGKSQIDLIGCQNDTMAMGAGKALQAIAEYLRRPELARTPITGCDGVPNYGYKLVSEGQLAATVIIPSTGAPAINLLIRSHNQGDRLPEEVLLQPISYPTEDSLALRSRAT